MPKPWTVLSSRRVYDRRPYMVMREDTVELPTGTRIEDYFVFEYPDWVIVLAVTKAGELVMIRQYRHGIGAAHYELAAGVVDAGEDLLVSAQRELLEETGFGGGDWQLWLQASANPGTHTNLAHIYLAEGVERLADQSLEHTEDIAVHVLPRAEARRLLENGGVMQALHAAALWKYFAVTIKG